MKTQRHAAGHTVTQRDIAARCGISQMAVSLALRHDPRVSKTTIEQVFAVAAELGYDPNTHQAARRMVLKRYGQDIINSIVAVFVPAAYYQFGYYTSIMRGILDVLTTRNFGLLTLYLPEPDQLDSYVLPPVFSAGMIDGVAMLGFPQIVTALRDRLRATPGFGHRPITSIMAPMATCSVVTAEEQGGAYAAAAHLLALGHRHIAQCYCTWGNFEEQHERLTGVRAAMQAAGLDPEHGHHPLDLGDMNWLVPTSLSLAEARLQLKLFAPPDGTPTTLGSYLAAHPEITAIICANDTNAAHAWYTVTQMGLRVPDDISIIGFDDTDPLTDEAGRNLLTTVALPLAAIGRQTAEQLLTCIDNPKSKAVTTRIPAHLVIRHSTAPCRHPV